MLEYSKLWKPISVPTICGWFNRKPVCCVLLLTNECIKPALYKPQHRAIVKGLNGCLTYSQKTISELQSIPAIWDHTVLPATRHRWICPTLTPTEEAGTWFKYIHEGRKAELTLAIGYRPRWFTCPQTVTHPGSNHLTATWPRVELASSKPLHHQGTDIQLITRHCRIIQCMLISIGNLHCWLKHQTLWAGCANVPPKQTDHTTENVHE